MISSITMSGATAVCGVARRMHRCQSPPRVAAEGDAVVLSGEFDRIEDAIVSAPAARRAGPTRRPCQAEAVRDGAWKPVISSK
jgi:hypothetical protein